MKFFAGPAVLFGLASALTAASDSRAVTYYKDIAPILYANCSACHRPGEGAPFSLLTYDDAKKRARQIAFATSSRYMPPWLPERGYGDFQGDRRLSAEQLRLIEQWVARGALAGSPSDSPPAPEFTPGWRLGKPDLVIQAARAYGTPASGPDVFWNFVLRSPVDSTRYVKAIEIRPGNTRIVHHANLLVDRARSARLRESSPGSGFPGMDVTLESDAFEPDSHFLFWKPGSVPWTEPDGLAWRIDKNSDLVLNVHLQSTGKSENLQPSVGLYFTDKPQTRFPMLLQLEHDGALDIPPGAKDFVVTDHLKLPVDLDVLAVYPHAHYLGKLLEGWADLPDGRRKWLIRIPDWDLNWQAVYRYREPLFLPKGSVISMRFHYDNSDANVRNPSHPPKKVEGGNQSTDEMGHLWLQVLPRGAEDQRPVLQEALMRRRLEKYPADFSAHFNLGALLLARKEPEAALPWLREAAQLQPDQVAALTTLGAALLQTGKPDEAIARFQRALELQPDYVNARYDLANALAEAGRLPESAAAFEQVLRDSPDDAAARDRLLVVLKTLAGSLASEGHGSEAAARIREALALHPGDAELHNNLGILLAQQGDRQAAVAEFQAALKADPGNQAARRNLDLARQP